MPQARRTPWMLLSFVILAAGCHSSEKVAQPPPPAPPPPAPAPPPPTSGLDARPSNTTCIAPDRATGSVTIGTERAFPNLKFQDPLTQGSNNPVFMLQAPGDASRWFVVEQFVLVRLGTAFVLIALAFAGAMLSAQAIAVLVATVSVGAGIAIGRAWRSMANSVI